MAAFLRWPSFFFVPTGQIIALPTNIAALFRMPYASSAEKVDLIRLHDNTPEHFLQFVF
jgi:hypothetical protein